MRLSSDDFLPEKYSEVNSYKKVIKIGDENSQLILQDTRADLKAFREKWIRENNGFVLTYSITSHQSLEQAAAIHEEVIKTKGQKTPFVLVGTKSD